MYDEHTQRVINESFGGDAGDYEVARAIGMRNTIKFSDLLITTKVYPDLELKAHTVIERLLGYLPSARFVLPYECFIRACIYTFRNTGITFDELLLECSTYVKLIRNDLLESHTVMQYEEVIYKKYSNYLIEASDWARSRVVKFLGYQPTLEHSVAAEIFLRQALLEDKFHFPDGLTTTDIQAVTLIKYREVLLAQGFTAANASPLIAAELICQQSSVQNG